MKEKCTPPRQAPPQFLYDCQISKIKLNNKRDFSFYHNMSACGVQNSFRPSYHVEEPLKGGGKFTCEFCQITGARFEAINRELLEIHAAQRHKGYNVFSQPDINKFRAEYEVKSKGKRS